MKLEAVDLNLLLAFDALYAERSVSRAAQRLGRSQPAMSNALGRLRRVFGDPLFARTAAGMQPTPRAENLARPIGEALRQARLALEGPPRFDPATVERSFTAAGSDYVETFLLPRLLADVAARAPGVTLVLQRTPFLLEPPLEALAAGHLDVAIGFFPVRYPPQSGLRGALLWPERFVGVVRRTGARPRRRRLTLADLVARGHVRVSLSGAPARAYFDQLLAEQGERRRVVVTVPHLRTVPEIVAETDLIGFIPERLAVLAERHLAIERFAPPFALPDQPLVLVWHERSAHEPAQQWLRERLGAAAAGRLPGPAAVPRGARLTRRGRSSPAP